MFHSKIKNIVQPLPVRSRILCLHEGGGKEFVEIGIDPRCFEDSDHKAGNIFVEDDRPRAVVKR